MNDSPPPVERLEQALRDLGRSFDIAAPDYAQPVLARIESGPKPGRVRIGMRGRIGGVSKLLVAAAAVLLALCVAVVVPASRHALASWLGFSGIEIRRTTGPAPSLTVPHTPAPLDAGPPSTLRAARSATSDRLQLPIGLPRPTRVFLRHPDHAVVVTLAYRRTPSLRPTAQTGFALVVTEIFDAGQPLFEKVLYGNAQAVEVHVRGWVGVFVAGPQEIMNVVPKPGRQESVMYEVSPRVSANTLIWADAHGTYRLEGDFTRRAALDLARRFG